MITSYGRTTSPVWEELNALFPEATESIGLSTAFVDHTGAIVVEKTPYSSRNLTYVDRLLEQATLETRQQPNGNLLPDAETLKKLLCNWENLPLYDLPSWQITNWADLITQDHLFNFVQVTSTTYARNNRNQASLPATAYSLASIRQFWGQKLLNPDVPFDVNPKEQVLTKPICRSDCPRICARAALEMLRWTEYPVRPLRCLLGRSCKKSRKSTVCLGFIGVF